ncbi:MAG: ABC transporter substrate-binding protein, partial [Leptotrichiaceae bacterium]|nr:ABC transporter substrate-binding protein [Leptotrichiaceae bacterium]
PLPQIYNEVLNIYEKNFVIGFTDSYIFDYDINSKITKKGAAEFSLDKKNKKFKIKIKNNMKWSDGHSLNADDIVFTYETVINKDFPNKNYGYDFMNIVGGEEYHNSQTSTISGIKKIDDRTVEVSFKEFSPGLSTPVDGMLAVALLPKHHLKDIPVKNLLDSDKVKINPVTLGAYIPVNITENKIILKANVHLYKGRAKTKQAVIEGKNIGEIMPFIKAGAYDLVYNMPNYAYEGIEKLNNMKIMGNIKNHVDVLIFNLGIYDKVKKENITDPSMKMSDIRLRKALTYALNIEEIEKNFPLTVKASSIIPPEKYGRRYFNAKLKGYEYNPGKAKQLLDEAGYKDVDGDGYREDKNGNYFEIKIAAVQNISEIWFFGQNRNKNKNNKKGKYKKFVGIYGF